MTTPIEIGVLGAQAAENMLLVHAESGARALHVDKTDALVQRVLSLCGGLPLALSVVGSLVRRRGWVSALELVDESGRGLLNLRVPGGEVRGRTEYESLRKCLQASLMALGEDTYDRERKYEQFLQLCVVRTKEQLPLTALCSFWNEEKPAVWEIATTLQDASLVTLQGKDSDESLRLSLHDLVVEFLAGAVVPRQCREDAHKQLVAGYCRRNPEPMRLFSGPRLADDEHVLLQPLWKLPSDGYVERALPRLLVNGGATMELSALLADMRFIAWRVEVAGGHCGLYRDDCRRVGKAVLDSVAIVVEGSLVDPLPLSDRLQQAAFEIAERFSSRWIGTAGQEDRSLLDHLCATARLYLKKPGVELVGSCRLRAPTERRIFTLDCAPQLACPSPPKVQP